MSDPTASADAPTSDAGNSGTGKSLSTRNAPNVPSTVLSAARVPDRILLRMNKLLATPGGLATFLSTANYALYLVVYLESKSAPVLSRIYMLLNRLTSRPLVTPAVSNPATGGSHVAALATLISQTRTTLRLFGLIPMYARLRQLLQGPKPGTDGVLYATALTQITLYMTFQFLENVALLTDSKVLAPHYTARWADKTGKIGKIYLWSYRAWFGGVLCDFVRLAREAQLERASRAERATKGVDTWEADRRKDETWWSELLVPIAWSPVAAQFSAEGGYNWFSLGLMGVCGVAANLSKTTAMWSATADA